MSNRRNVRSVSGATLLFLTIAAGIGSAQAPPSSSGSQKASRSAPVALALKTDKTTYAAGETITATLTARNPGKQKVTLDFTSGQKYDLELWSGKDRRGKRLWQWSKGRMFTEALASLSLLPGKPLVFTEKIVSGKDEVPKLAPGVYRLIAYLTTASRMPHPTSTTLFIVK